MFVSNVKVCPAAKENSDKSSLRCLVFLFIRIKTTANVQKREPFESYITVCLRQRINSGLHLEQIYNEFSNFLCSSFSTCRPLDENYCYFIIVWHDIYKGRVRVQFSIILLEI